jgi:uncharacterized protein YhbP (UPF0306 family)
MTRRLVTGLAALVVMTTPAAAQRATFTPTLYWDSGLIDTPVAWVSPLGGDLSFHATRVAMDSTAPLGPKSGSKSYNVSMSASLWGRAEVGFSVFTSDLRGGLFAKGLIWDQQDGAFRTGMVHWMPSFAVGMRNVGIEKGLTRWAEPGQAGFNTSPTLYAVATRTFAVGEVSEPGARAKTQITVNAGVGNGLFSDNGGLGSLYAKHATGGFFGGAKVDFATSRFSNLAIIAEHNAWDYNVGAVYEVQGLRFAAYLLEADAGSASKSSWSYSKVAFSIGWQTNALALVRGNRMEERVAQMERERDQLSREIRAGEARVSALEGQLRTVEGATEADRRAQRELLEQKLKEEQDALKRLQERLNARKPPE